MNNTSVKHRPKMLPTPSAKAFLQTQTRFLSIVGPTGVEKTTEKVEKSLPKTPVQRSSSVRPRGYDGGLTPKLDPRGSKAIFVNRAPAVAGALFPALAGTPRASAPLELSVFPGVRLAQAAVEGPRTSRRCRRGSVVICHECPKGPFLSALGDFWVPRRRFLATFGP